MFKFKLVIITFILYSLIFYSFSCNPEQKSDELLLTKSKDNSLRYTLAEDGLRFREAASQDSKIIALIPLNTEVKILEEGKETFTIDNKVGKWSKLNWQEKEGWVFSGYLGVDPVNPSVSFLRHQISFEGGREEAAIKTASLYNKINKLAEPKPQNDEHYLFYSDKTLWLFLKNDYKLKNALSINAKTDNLNFTKIISAEQISSATDRMVISLPFYNYYWFSTQAWSFTVYDGKEIIFTSKIEIEQLQFLIYQKKTDSPFKNCIPNPISRRTKYTFDSPAEQPNSFCVFYYSHDKINFYPFLVLYQKEILGKRKLTSFSLNSKAPAGFYLLLYYKDTDLPPEGQKLTLENIPSILILP